MTEFKNLDNPMQYLDDGKDFFVDGELSNTFKDLGNDFIDLNCLKSMQRQIAGLETKVSFGVTSGNTVGRDHEHHEGLPFNGDKNIIPIGEFISGAIEPAEHEGKSGFKLMVREKANKAHPYFDNFKGSIENKSIKGFSIEYKILSATPNKTRAEMGNTEVRVIHDLVLKGATHTSRPMCATCTITGFEAKSETGDTMSTLKFVNKQGEIKDTKVSLSGDSVSSQDIGRFLVGCDAEAKSPVNTCACSGSGEEEKKEILEVVNMAKETKTVEEVKTAPVKETKDEEVKSKKVKAEPVKAVQPEVKVENAYDRTARLEAELSEAKSKIAEHEAKSAENARLDELKSLIKEEVKNASPSRVPLSKAEDKFGTEGEVKSFGFMNRFLSNKGVGR